MNNKMTAVLAGLVLSVGVIGTVYVQSAFAISQSGSSTASDTSTDSQTATNNPSATSSVSGNGNGNGNNPSGDNGNGNGNALSNADSHQSTSHHTSAEVKQKASCDNKKNNGLSGNSC